MPFRTLIRNLAFNQPPRSPKILGEVLVGGHPKPLPKGLCSSGLPDKLSSSFLALVVTGMDQCYVINIPF